MRIVQLTPGTGCFPCGPCLRDLALVEELRRLGDEVLHVPLYLPWATEGGSACATQAPVRLGAVDLYLRHRFAAIRHAPVWLGRALDAPWLLRQAARRAGTTRPEDLGAMTLEMLRGGEGTLGGVIRRFAVWLREQGHADAVCLSNSLLAGMARPIAEALGAPVVFTFQGEQRFLDALPPPYREEAWNALARCVPDADAFVAVSRWCADRMARRLGLPAERVHVVLDGIRLDDLHPPEALPVPPAVGFLARMTEAHGLAALAAAFTELRRRPGMGTARLRIAGACTPADEPYVRKVREQLGGASLADACEWRPNLDRAAKAEFLRGLSVLCVPARDEAFGLYVLEALACGVPVVLPRDGAFPELVAATGGGTLYSPEEPGALPEALAALLGDLEAACALGRRGCTAVREAFTAERMAREVRRILQGLRRP